MKIKKLHNWDVGYNEAVSIQNLLKKDLIFRDDIKLQKVRSVAGADISYSRGDSRFFAVVAIFTFPDMELLEQASYSETVTFPYIPGFLSFREGPLLLKAFEAIKHAPDVVIFDGQGRVHPRGLGIASHLGLFLDVPTVGCGKSKLVGDYKEPGNKQGDYSPLIYHDQVVGFVLRTKRNVKPVFVSEGHKITLETATQLVLKCCRGYRLPEPTRKAHLLVNQFRQRSRGDRENGAIL